ncbi:MAG: hypothetical protein N2110_00775 [Flavobacteriales bacterium]|nr:hypothetical protein [Flavobacteriales bacterium]MCX7767544.1 hypothetical protein [Flavobacteriales bacterium]MDW8410383.1 hypothetical protein [Flavobacteriales bacterium]
MKTTHLFETWRVKVLRESDYEPVWSFRLSLADVLVAVAGFLFFTVFFTFFFVAFTPLRQYLPGYADPTLRKDALALKKQADSLESEIHLLYTWARQIQQQYQTAENTAHGN